jgi:UDP-glucose 4-epimerase
MGVTKHIKKLFKSSNATKDKILVTGGLGYIGSHTVVELIEAGYEICIVDNLSNSNIDVLKGIEKITGIKPVY